MLRFDKKEAKELLTDHVEWSGGVTVVDEKILDKDHGYMVGVGKEVVFDYLEDLLEYVAERKLSSYGIWKNTKMGVYVVDVDVRWVKYEEEALELAMKHKQIAVYDFANQEDIKPTYIVEFYWKGNPDKPYSMYVSKQCAKNVIFEANCRKIAFKNHDMYVITAYEDYLKRVK